MNKTIKIEVPEEITIQQYTNIGELEHLSEIEKIIRIVSSISGYEEEEIKTWDLKSLNQIYTDLIDAIENISPIFLPLFEYKGIKYGLQPLSKMSAGEYIDLERKIEQGDMVGTIATLYRPITKNNLSKFKWHDRKIVRFIKGKTENLFKYYRVEEYDNETVEWRRDIFKDLPVSIALGAYTFFLTVGLQLSNSILQSSKEMTKAEKEIQKEAMESLLQSISVGSTSSTDSQKMEDYSGSREKQI